MKPYPMHEIPEPLTSSGIIRIILCGAFMGFALIFWLYVEIAAQVYGCDWNRAVEKTVKAVF
jgi:hypothetical protein